MQGGCGIGSSRHKVTACRTKFFPSPYNFTFSLTDNHRTWGFMLCFLYLRDVRGFG